MNCPLPTRSRPRLVAFAIAFALVAGPVQARDWSAFPALTSLRVGGAGSHPSAAVAAQTESDSGYFTDARYDRAANAWSTTLATNSAEVAGREPPPRRPRLDQVLVFNGGLFDLFAGRDTIDLGAGFTLARRDTGFALLEGTVDLGWPAVTEAEVERWGREVRLGLPSEFPEDRLLQLLSTGRLHNVPGPTIVTDDALWFGLAGGFTGGDGQLGGVVSYDRTSHTFRVHRHKFMVDASVTRLLVLDDALWIGTGRFGPTRLEGLRGVVLYRPKKREWRQFSPDNSRISGDLIYDLAGDGRMVWATTNQGVSRYDTTRRLWTSWYWHAVGGDGGFELTQALPGDVAEEQAR